ncbi:MAG: amidohydrolase family protein [Sediminibacterium sp. Gen4]|jgi:imidazolonepropionase-like amidohydrolase|uniref:metal-dependent hydrolase family protein n=1 Tax=unclassified Sediminibacterium TaxID=2635961 RepID=UPI0015BBAE08|nr:MULTISPECIES: amidohydrolase family protein [unclassified Sediminibacterium]MBW0160809.1 amidohydrolase family protein [Sediminibacterium sp.]MBW0164233.1 amidohydrolase family protein [Sediminibacterium sp.]NWK65475.1 amidohydrolase family protein [Sediminibacterium sp. Gen4]
MRLSLTLFCLLLFICPYGQTTVIKAKSYLDIRAGKLIVPAVLIIENGLIKEINPKTIPEGAAIIDLGSKTILPGLMDMHVHLEINLDPGYNFHPVTENASKRVLRAASNAKLTLMSGFTTVRNMGQTHPSRILIDVALSEASDKDWIEAPRIIPSGHMLSITGGHGDPAMHGGFSEGVMDLGPENGVADGVDEVIKATRYQIKYGARVIKIMATAGVFSLENTVGAQQFTYEEMKAIVDEARRHEVKVAAHAHGTEGIISAIHAGVASIEHGSILDDIAINLMKEKGVYLVPTTALMDLLADSYDKLDKRIVEKAKYVTALGRESHSKAFKLGVRVAMGTDAPLVPHGKNALEITAMVKRGMKPLEAIRASTINSADLLGIKDRGELKAGLLADIIAVEGNPLDQIEILEKVYFVMKGGKIYKHQH